MEPVVPVPGADMKGGAFHVTVNYVNFSNAPATPGPDTMLMQLHAAGNPLMLAEVPVEIPGDRGTKTFTVSIPIPVDSVDYYQVDFIVNERRFDTRIVARNPL